MIITKLVGGLGNQLFQYCVGRQLAITHREVLKLDISAFDTYKIFQYELDNFNINAEIAKPGEIAAFMGWKSVYTKTVRKIAPSMARRGHITERSLYFDPTILNLSSNVLLEGYWQSPRYFTRSEDEIRQELTVRKELRGKNRIYFHEIGATESVMLHVRRGDYVGNAYHGTCSVRYYQKAIQSIARRVHSPRIYVFSDDPAWARSNIQCNYPTVYISHNKKDKPHEDLRLMSSAKHFIIANSTFSWWAAWLSCNNNKIVIAPKVWFSGEYCDSRDLIPISWERI